MRKSKSLYVGTLVIGWAAACGAPSPGSERTALTSSPIQGGTPDKVHTFVVGVVQLTSQQAAFCSGALLAPNLVATARHCVAAIGSAQIDCATSTFGALVPTNEMLVTQDSTVQMTSAFAHVVQIVVPSGADQTKVCGNDIALLILDRKLTLPQYVAPVISPPMTDHGTYSTSVTAIGYGVDTPTDTQGASAGVRRIKENIPLYCVPNDKVVLDCFSDPKASQVLTKGEFVSGDASTCEGDSGSNAFDQTGFSNGAWVSFGVLSRGGVSADGMTCTDPIYSRFDAWGPLLVDAANQAASMGGYSAPAWATTSTPVGGDAGTNGGGPAGQEDGTSCAHDSDCKSSNCVVVGSGTNFVCASQCVALACPANFQCTDGFCFPSTSAQSQVQSSHSGGCSLLPGSAPWETAPWRTLAAGLGVALFALRRRRST